MIFRREDTNIGAKNERFGCQFCPRKFPTKTKAARHEESHDLIRRWGCRHCAKQYKDKYDVKKHLCSAHGHNNENWEEGARYIGTDIEPPMIGPVKTRRPRKALASLALNATLDSCSKNNSSFVGNAPANQFGFSNFSNQQSSSGPFFGRSGATRPFSGSGGGSSGGFGGSAFGSSGVRAFGSTSFGGSSAFGSSAFGSSGEFGGSAFGSSSVSPFGSTAFGGSSAFGSSAFGSSNQQSSSFGSGNNSGGVFGGGFGRGTGGFGRFAQQQKNSFSGREFSGFR